MKETTAFNLLVCVLFIPILAATWSFGASGFHLPTRETFGAAMSVVWVLFVVGLVLSLIIRGVTNGNE